MIEKNDKIFLDVGSHNGETINAALDPKYGFNRVICFEPAEQCWAKLSRFHDPRVIIQKFGLWNKTDNVPLV